MKHNQFGQEDPGILLIGAMAWLLSSDDDDKKDNDVVTTTHCTCTTHTTHKD